ncbi:NXPE family member 1-like isoform X2 [Eublepharis macularius]|uniref:NXPE family member 1-like isoform X2 n=1 Tax=Eublepharis macularius TaxID=481883 RepID=A0AA97KAD9_EUBMA|nr:NXPE family member 1-like isoform X2 [Eublepharis macularius]
MQFSVTANRQRAFLAAVLVGLAMLSYFLHRTEIKVTFFGSHSESCIKQLAQTEEAFCHSFTGDRIGQRDQSALCTVWAQQRRKKQEMEDILTKLDQQMPSITFRDVKTTTSAKNSKATLLSHKDSYCVGDHLIVRLDLYDHLGKRKRYGGDFLRARVYSPGLKAGASGQVEDYKNGTYLVNFTLFWEGDVRVSILLIHPSEGVSAMWAARKKGYEKIAFTGKFLNGTSEVFTECGFNITTKEELCEYLDERDQEAFYCVKPKHVPCDAFIHLKSNNRPMSYLTPLEKSLFNRSNIGVEIPQTFGNIRVLSCNTLKFIDCHRAGLFKTHLVMDPERNTFVQWKKHGHPFVTKEFYSIKDDHYVPRAIDRVAGGESTAVVLTLGQHFRPFPMNIFVRRLLNVREAIQRLHLRSPGTRVIVKAENIREIYIDPERLGDVHGYPQNLVTRNIFRGLNIGFIDAWDMTTAYATNDVHPHNHVVWSQIVMLLTYIC